MGYGGRVKDRFVQGVGGEHFVLCSRLDDEGIPVFADEQDSSVKGHRRSCEGRRHRQPPVVVPHGPGLRIQAGKHLAIGHKVKVFAITTVRLNRQSVPISYSLIR